MGKKKPGVAASSKEDQQQAPKGKKTNMKIDDDEYEMVDSVDVVADEIEAMSLKTKEDDASTLFSGKKKPSKKGKKSKEEEEEDDDDNKSDLVSMNSVEEDLGEGKKGKKKGKGGKPKTNDMFSALAEMDDSDEGPKEDDEEEEDNTVFAGKKKSKGKKGKKDTTDKFSILAQLEEAGGDAPEEEQEAPSIALAGKKKGKGKKGRRDDFDDDFAIVPDVEQDTVEEPTDIVFTGKKKTKGKKSVQFSALEDLEDGNNDASSLEDENEIVFAGKKKSKGKKGGKAEENLPPSKFALLDDEDEHNSEDPEEFVFSGKKKSKSKKGGKGKHEESVPQSKFSILSDEDMVDGKEDDEADEEIVFSGKKKSKGKKNKQDDVPVSTVSSSVVVSEKDAEEVESGVTTGASKKQKKKTKKSVRTAQEEDDLERILAELGEGLAQPSTSKAAAALPEEASTSAPAASTSEQAEQEDNAPAESAAAKKKKKKKEKEKEKKAAASAEIKEDEKVEEPKGKAADKKMPKHVREMQERLAKVREAEEKRRQEEEEKLRKEEEERLRLEEIERQKEEARRRKKEREKEKLLKKKQEGKLLTGKKKEEAKRLAMMREQFLAQSALSTDVLKEDHGAPKKPKYDTKKKKHSPAVAEQLASSKEEVLPTKEEDEVGPELETGTVEEQPTAEMEEKQEEEEEEEEDDWDAKSWDEKDVVLRTKNAFDEDEEVETVPTKNLRKNGPVQHANGSPATSKQPAQPSNKPQNEDEDSEDADSDSEAEGADSKKRSDTSLKRDARKADAISKRSSEDLRSPICCILGHVDTGKTKLLDCIRRTNVQEGEAGGITQQIGATYFPMENIRERTKELKPDANLRVPGLLVIDTPGHEAFNNLRARGSSSCDIAILVVDIMHGLEPQTIESLNLLKARHTPFVVALNKVDRLYGWKSRPNAPIKLALKNQTKDVQAEFESRLQEAIQSLQAQGMNSELYYRNKDVRKYVSIVPTSAISGEGVPDLLLLLIQMTQKMMEEKLMYISEVQCTVLEVKVIEGLGTTIDVILINGVLHEGDQIVVCGMQGPIVTSIRALLTPHPMKEIRVKGSYLHHKELKAAQGIKIVGQGLEHAIAGTQLYIVGPDDDLEDMKREAMEDIETVMSRIDKTGEGVCVQASTLGSLEALLEFLKTPAVNIPVSGISIGPVHKKDIMKASVMLEKKKKEYAAILAFDVKVTPDARELAEELGVKIFMADIIYHLFDQFKAYVDNIKEEKKKEAAEEAVFPCVLKILPNCVFNKKDPIIVGVDILEGIARVGTQLCVPSQEFIDIGKIASIEINHKAVNVARKGQQVAMKIAAVSAEEAQKMVGRHFDVEDELVSHVTRRSIDILKENYRDDLSNEEWKLVVKLKKLFKIA